MNTEKAKEHLWKAIGGIGMAPRVASDPSLAWVNALILAFELNEAMRCLGEEEE